MKRRVLLKGMLGSGALLLGGIPLLSSHNKPKKQKLGVRGKFSSKYHSYEFYFHLPKELSYFGIKMTPEQIYLGPHPNQYLSKEHPYDPFLRMEDATEEFGEDYIKVTLKGHINFDKRYPFVLEIETRQLQEGLYEIRGYFPSFPTLPRGLKARGFCPCFQSDVFAKQNDVPMRMAEQTFIMTQRNGFSWTADAKRWIEHTRAPWYQLFPSRLHPEYDLPKDKIVQPVIGWVEQKQRLMVALWGHQSMEAGPRLGPCLHNNIWFDNRHRERPMHFSYRLYTGPVDLDNLILLEAPSRTSFLQDFTAQALRPMEYGKSKSTRLVELNRDSLWPYTKGETLLSLERQELPHWKTEKSTLALFTGSKRKWSNGNFYNKKFTADLYEGKEALLWEGDTQSKATVRRMLPHCTLQGKLPTHISVYMQNREGDTDVAVEMRLEKHGKILVKQEFAAFTSASQRLLLSLQKPRSLEGTTLVFQMLGSRDKRFKLILDDLRCYHSETTASLA